MNKVEHVADESVRGLKEQGGIELEPDDALIVARLAISVLGQVHEDKFAWPLPDGRNSKASTKLGKSGYTGLGACLIYRIWLASLCQTTSAQPYVKMNQHVLAVVMGDPRRYKRPLGP